MSPSLPVSGPSHLRWLIGLFNVGFLVLFFWFTGFVVNDIGEIPAPSYAELESELIDPNLLKSQLQFQQELELTRSELDAEQRRLQTLRSETDSSQKTMDQLLEFQRLRVEKSMAISVDEQTAMAVAQRQFFEKQDQYQQRAAAVTQLNEELLSLEQQQKKLLAQLDESRQPVHREYEQRMEQHNWKVALWKLGVLIPLLLAVCGLFWGMRKGTYAAMVLMAVLAVSARVISVMHDHFPSQYFKYIFLGVMLAVVGRTLAYLLRSRAHPCAEVLLKRYREAYEAFLCPVCDFPIRRGPWKFMAWTAKSVLKITPPVGNPNEVSDEPYTCPACSVSLYEKCVQCNSTRPSLLPTCPQCGFAAAVVPDSTRR